MPLVEGEGYSLEPADWWPLYVWCMAHMGYLIVPAVGGFVGDDVQITFDIYGPYTPEEMATKGAAIAAQQAATIAAIGAAYIEQLSKAPTFEGDGWSVHDFIPRRHGQGWDPDVM